MKPKISKSLLLGALLLGGSRIMLRAQTYSIDWYTVVGGGGVSSNGQYTISGTIGQSDASGLMTGGSYSLIGGFWSLLSVVQTFPGPLLSITPTSTNTVVLSWPSPSVGFILQQNANLGTTNWADSPRTPADDGTTRSVVINPPTGNVYYRLKK